MDTNICSLSNHRLDWLLRIPAAMCFIGHGTFGITTKAGWVPYFGVGRNSRGVSVEADADRQYDQLALSPQTRDAGDCLRHALVGLAPCA